MKKKNVYWPTKQWEEAKPQEVGISNDIIYNFHRELGRRTNGIHCSLIVKNGYIIHEDYANGFDQNTPGNVYSVTKSFLSAMIGSAIDLKLIKLQDRVVDYFDDFVLGPQDWHKEDVTIENLLTMSSGIFCPTNAGFNNRMSQNKNELNMLLRLPVNRSKIGKFSYNDANYNLLARILCKITKELPIKFAQEVLFSKIGIGCGKSAEIYPEWEADTQGINYGGFGLNLSGRDMAKLGYLYLLEGIWDGSPLLSKEWISLSTSSQIVTTEKGLFYGYGWWTCQVHGAMTYYAIGAGGQYIICTPALGLIQVYLCEKNSMACREVEHMWKKMIQDIME